MVVIINPGTEGRGSATLENAQVIVDRICDELTIPKSSVSRLPAQDRPEKGYWAFQVSSLPPFSIDVPGDDPDNFFLSKPFESRRMYVDGSSWLWRYAIGTFERCLGRKA